MPDRSANRDGAEKRINTTVQLNILNKVARRTPTMPSTQSYKRGVLRNQLLGTCENPGRRLRPCKGRIKYLGYDDDAGTRIEPCRRYPSMHILRWQLPVLQTKR